MVRKVPEGKKKIARGSPASVTCWLCSETLRNAPKRSEVVIFGVAEVRWLGSRELGAGARELGPRKLQNACRMRLRKSLDFGQVIIAPSVGNRRKHKANKTCPHTKKIIPFCGAVRIQYLFHFVITFSTFPYGSE